ncbi:hypothetical protein D1AOALGA4SA_8368 [Olavius algarvensis Delta 1 endosymbiont]|nr:hypothetical protein D1AOALGA4SA_8368 [Olavius algarvensis Delta 1 endosymbiont]
MRENDGNFGLTHAIVAKVVAIVAAAGIIWTGCGGGGGSNGSTSPTVISGTFVDSPVKGLAYETASQSGLTDEKGTFKYIAGETVAFYIGDIALGESAAKETITPIDLVAGAVDETDPTVTNICRFLLSLDHDGNPDNGINLSPQTRQEAEFRNIDLRMSVADFENDPDVQSFLDVLNALNAFADDNDQPLYPAEQARSHLRVTLAQMKEAQYIIEIDLGQIEMQGPTGIELFPNDEIISDDRILIQREWSHAEPAEIDTLIAAINSTAFDTYHQFTGNRLNLCFSPYAISRLMAMAFPGAGGETALEIQTSMNFAFSDGRLPAVFNALDLSLDPQRFAGADPGDTIILDTDAAAWGQSGYFVPAAYFNSLAANFGAPIKPLNFQRQSYNSDSIIESWISERSGDLLSKTISSVSDRVRLALANMITLNANWAQPFNPDLTADGFFKTISGSNILVPLMSNTGEYLYTHDESLEAINLRFEENSLAMLVMLPESGNYSDFENTLDLSVFQSIVESLEPRTISFTMPKYSFDIGKDLVNAYNQLGISTAMVEGDADFSGINPADDLYINGSRITANISVKESGVQGACSAVLSMEGNEEIPDNNGLESWMVTIGNDQGYWDGLIIWAPQPPAVIPSITLGRPFIFIIHDTETGIILNIGRVMDPSD